MLQVKTRMNGMYKVLISYLLILVIPIVIGFFVHYKTLHVIEEESKQSGLAMMDQTGKIVDEQLDFITGITNRLAVNSNIMRFSNVKLPLIDQNYYELIELTRELESQRFLNAYIKDILLIYKNSDIVLTTRGTYDGSEGYEKFIKYGSLSYQEWTEEMTTPGYTFHKPQTVLYSGGPVETLAFSFPINPGGGAHIDASVVVYIDLAKIRSILTPVSSRLGGWAFAVNKADEVMVTTDSKGITPLDFALTTAEGSFISIDSVRYYVTSSKSALLGWRYFLITPEDVFLNKVKYVRQSIWIITLISLIFGAITALYLSYRNRRPFVRLIRELHDISTSHDELKNVMEQQLPVLQTVFIEKVMRGEFKSEGEAKTFAEHAKLSYKGNVFIWIVIRIENYDGSITNRNVQELQNNKFIIKNLVNDLLLPVYANDLNEDTVALLHISAESEAECEKRLEEGLGKLLQLITNKFKINSHLTVGSFQPRITESWKSFYEAFGASDLSVMNQILWTDLLDMSNDYYFPLEIEHKLVHTVKGGDEEALNSLLEHIFTSNFKQRKISVDNKHQLIMELKGSVYKIISQIPKNEGTLRSEIEKAMEKIDIKDVTYSFNKLSNVFKELQRCYIKLKQSQHHEIIFMMLDYVNKHFSNPDLSLTTLATDFELSENYISFLFKDRMENNFSTYLENLRMGKACELLETTDMSIQDIAIQVGYNNDKSFRRAFKRVKGVQPTVYRDQS